MAVAVGVRGFVASPLVWSLLTGVVALILLLPRGRAVMRILGGVVGVLSGPRPVTAWGKYWHTHVIESVKDLPELIDSEF